MLLMSLYSHSVYNVLGARYKTEKPTCTVWKCWWNSETWVLVCL